MGDHLLRLVFSCLGMLVVMRFRFSDCLCGSRQLLQEPWKCTCDLSVSNVRPLISSVSPTCEVLSCMRHRQWWIHSRSPVLGVSCTSALVLPSARLQLCPRSP